MSEISIEEVALAFTEWRNQRKTRGTTPENLKSMAISLLPKHSINEICKRLSVNSSMLKAWGGLKNIDTVPAAKDFVTITHEEVTSNQNEMVLSLNIPNGIQCQLTGALEPVFVAKLLQFLQGGYS